MIQKPRGTQDVFSINAKKWNALNSKFYNVLTKYSFSEMITPMFESKEVFVRGVGDATDIVQKEMYEFKDKKGRELVLRPEMTAPIVRSFIENKLYSSDNLPLKVFYSGPLFRYERPQYGRYRQFNQFGVEVFGNDSLEQDVEIVLLAKELLAVCQIEQNLSFEFNYLINGDERKTFEEALFKKINEINDLCLDCQKRKQQNILRVLDCKLDQDKFIDLPNMNDFISFDDKKRFEKTIAIFKSFGIQANINNKLVRGLDYYTGLVFEIINKKNNQALLAGGRYNNLVETMGGPSTSAIGFAIGWERLINTIEENNVSILEERSLDAFIIPISQRARLLTNQLLWEGRQNNLNIDTNWNITNLKNGFKASEKVLPKNLIIIGDKNIEANLYEIKSKISNSVVNLKYQEIINYLRNEKGDN